MKYIIWGESSMEMNGLVHHQKISWRKMNFGYHKGIKIVFTHLTPEIYRNLIIHGIAVKTLPKAGMPILPNCFRNLLNLGGKYPTIIHQCQFLPLHSFTRVGGCFYPTCIKKMWSVHHRKPCSVEQISQLAILAWSTGLYNL